LNFLFVINEVSKSDPIPSSPVFLVGWFFNNTYGFTEKRGSAFQRRLSEKSAIAEEGTPPMEEANQRTSRSFEVP